MRHALNIGKEPNLQKIVITSAVLHLLFITLATVPIKTKEREYKSYFVDLVGPAAVRSRAVKSSPAKKSVKAKIKKETVKVKPPLQKKIRPAPKADMSLEPANRVKKEIERLQALSALSKVKKEKEERLAKTKKGDEEIAAAIAGIQKRKQISVSESTGVPGTQSPGEIDAYSALIQQKILSEWIHPEFDAYLEAIISFRIDREGKVVYHNLEKSSGNTLFDRSAIKAVLKASPLPPPPVEEEVEIRFHL